MTAYATGRIRSIIEKRPGLVRAEMDDGSRAYALTQLTGPVSDGDRVVLNTTAVDLGLGTGGWHVIHWNLDAPPFREPGPGHLMKLRYTSLQTDTGAAEEQHPDLPERLDGMPVLVAGLHSQLPVLAAMIATRRPGTRIVYVMTDGGALPLALSDTVATLRDLGILHAAVTTGHAFGGDLEALNVPSALALARHRLDADVVIVAMGPGVAGTASRLGFTGLECAPALDAAAWLGGRPILCPRGSEADPRPRHRGISHHSRTVLDAVRSEIDVAVPPEVAAVGERHRWHHVEPGDVGAVLDSFDLVVRSMGRGIDEDPFFFRLTASAAVHAADQMGVQP